MMYLLIHWLITALVLMGISQVMPGITVQNFTTALIAAFVLGVINILIRPLVMLLTLPINLLTLGLFGFIINALMFLLASWIVPGFVVSNFLSALAASLLLGFITGLMGMLMGSDSGNNRLA